MSLAKRRLATLSVLLAALMILLSGCGGGMATALKIAGVKALLPDKWTSNSSIVTLIADILSGSSLRQVIAHISNSGDSTPIVITMTRNAEGKYEGSFVAPVQETEPVTYTAVVIATDATGNQATSVPVEIETPSVEGIE